MFHGNAQNTCIVPAMASGACLVLRPRFSASGFLPDVRRYGVTYFNYVGRALAYILATEPLPDDGENTLRFGFGTDASPSDIAAFKKTLRLPDRRGVRVERRGHLHEPRPGHTAPGHRHAPAGDRGGHRRSGLGPRVPAGAHRCQRSSPQRLRGHREIVSRNGAQRFEGYYANEEAEAERTRGGWFWSGDLGYRDEAGFFYFAGRPADWLRVDGENFAAAPVERILARFPGVVTAAVYPVPDPRTGDQVMATLELAPGTAFDPTAFADFLAAQADLGTKWAPRFVRLVVRIPLTGTNKVDKRPLRPPAWITDDPVWWRPFVGRHSRRRVYRLLTPADVDGTAGRVRRRTVAPPCLNSDRRSALAAVTSAPSRGRRVP
jgi:fatty-acyl-CoA synthase